MEQNRRDFLARTTLGTALVAAPSILTGISAPALAKAPFVGTQAPSFYRYKFGEFEITALHEGEFTRPLDANFVRNAELKDVQDVLAESYLPTDKINISFTTVVVNTGSKLVLVDTGFHDNGGPTNGKTVAQLKAAGIEPKDIDVVLLTHFHGDHLQGARAKDGKLVYPNAEVIVPENEWAFWMDDAKMAAAPEGMKGAFGGVHRVLKPNAADVKRVKWGTEVVTGITAVEAAGHTPGHTIYALSSGGKTMLLVADITNLPALFVRKPEWQVMFDMDPAQAIATRKRVLDMAVTDKLQVAFYHAPFPATGYISKDGTGYRFVPVQWSSAL